MPWTTRGWYTSVGGLRDPRYPNHIAHIKYLTDGRYTVERIEKEGLRDSTSLTLLRVRPVLPATAPAGGSNSGRR